MLRTATTPNRHRRIGTDVRRFMAKRPWVYWLVVALLAAIVAAGVADRLAAVERARSEWGDSRAVWVADADIEIGQAITATRRQLPRIAAPGAALDASVDTAPPDGLARQRIRHGEVIVDADITPRSGPASTAAPGHVVVAIDDPLLATAVDSLAAGLGVAVYADGVLLTDRADIADITGGVVFVAVPDDDAAVVAAAAQMRIASLAFTP